MFSSIRQRLLITLVLIITLIGSVTLLRSYLDARYEVQELFDAQLAQSARVIQAQVLPKLRKIDPKVIQEFLDTQSMVPQFQQSEDTNDDADHEMTEFGHEYERKIAFQIWGKKKHLILHSSAAPKVPLSEKSLTSNHAGYTDVVIDKTNWRVFSLWDNQRLYMVQVGERYDVRDELIKKISRRLVMPSLISVPILAFFIWFGVGRGLTPLVNVSKEISRRDPNYLEPILLGPVPKEIRPVAEALNKLFARLAEALEKERRFTDDAAHELRTPLAALKTQAQVALRATDKQEQQRALQQILQSVDRASHLVQQMLTLARLSPEKVDSRSRSINLFNASADIIAQHATQLAFEKNIDLSLTGDEQVKINAEPTSLSILISNLVDNAIKYTPNNGTVNVNISSIEDDGVVLTIKDSGPGIDEQLQQRVFDRFYRVVGNSSNGSGLGLAIAQQSAKNLSASISMENDKQEGGLIVTVTFRRAD